jgi:hypothetical protein
MTIMGMTARILAVANVLTMTACGGDSATSPTPNPGGSTGGATITITNSGAWLKNVTIVRGAQVTFVNDDSRPHDIRSAPHPSHGDCPEINQVGVIQPGNNRQTGNLVTPRTCGFHDENNASDSSLQGTIQIQ